MRARTRSRDGRRASVEYCSARTGWRDGLLPGLMQGGEGMQEGFADGRSGYEGAGRPDVE